MEALGIAHLANRRLETLSGGERQLTALAGMLTLGQESLLVLDQPTLSLDIDARRRLLSTLQAHCAAGGSVLVTGHQHDDITAACERLLFLGARGLTEHPVAGVTHDLLTSHGVWDARSTDPASSSGAGESRGTERTAALHSVTPPKDPPAEAPALQLCDVSVQRVDASIFTGLYLTLHPGHVTALLGPNGAGKSTLMMAVAGLLEKQQGVIISGRITAAGGIDLSALPVHRRAGHTAWVGQDPGTQISASTVRKELERALPRHRPRGARRRADGLREEQLTRVLECTGLTEHAADHPYDLSPSRRKDLVIATALLLEPQVMLLDEPTLGRDAAAMQQLNRMIAAFSARGCAVLVSTHDRFWAEDTASSTYLLESGRLRQIGAGRP